MSQSADGTDMIDQRLDDWLRDHHQAVLITIRRDGSPQSSNISYAWNGQSARISVTADRAKTRNVQRDPRVVLHVLGDNFWQSVQIQGEAVLGPVSVEGGDEGGRALLELYESIAGQHPDHEEYFAAMVAEHRQVLSVLPTKVIANIG